MTTNREKAAEVIDHLRAKGKGSYLTAAELDKAGLLQPDPPEPSKNSITGTPVWWKNDTLGVTVYPDGEIAMKVGSNSEACYTAETAREQALALLAAANHAEEKA